MARVKGRDTKPELRVRKALHAAGLRYRLHAPDLPGRPDIVFRSARIVVFVHGCFWHRHSAPDCRLTRSPKSRQAFWEDKFARNKERDARDQAALEAAGWKVLVIWECEINQPGRLRELVEQVRQSTCGQRNR